MSKLIFRANSDAFRLNGNIELRIGREAGDGHDIVRPLQMERIAAGEYVAPAVTLAPDEAQQLMDELWRCGIRPTEGRGSAGQLEAVQRHLEDMRRIAEQAPSLRELVEMGLVKRG